MILQAVEAKPDITLVELRALLAERSVAVAVSSLWRFFARRKITFRNESAYATEQDRSDLLKRRQTWFDGQFDLDPARLVFIDETRASTKVARLHGRAPRGQRLRAGMPQGHW